MDAARIDGGPPGVTPRDTFPSGRHGRLGQVRGSRPFLVRFRARIQVSVCLSQDLAEIGCRSGENLVALMLMLGEARYIGVVGGVVVAEEFSTVCALVVITIPDLDDGKCSDDQCLLHLEQRTIPEAQPDEELAGATGRG